MNNNLIKIIYFVILMLVHKINGYQEKNESHVADNDNVPCSYFDTVDLTSSLQFPNGSYLHDGIIIPKNLTALYDYHLLSLTERVSTKSHYRGCICLIRTCIKWCCNNGEHYYSVDADKHKCIQANQTLNTKLTIRISSTNENITKNLLHFFYSQINYQPCSNMIDLHPEIVDYDAWQLFDNGMLYRFDDEMYFPNKYFCLSQQYLDENSTETEIVPFVCENLPQDNTINLMYSYTILLSLPFMVITIIVYLSIPKLRNLHGKCLVCYLSGLVIGYSIFSYLLITSGKRTTLTTCAILGYSAYFFFMSSFFWLSVISFDLYWSFRTTGHNRHNEKKRLIIYCLYAWGLSVIFLVFTIFAQNSNLIPKSYKPGIGTVDYCWFDVKTNYSATIYFYGPCLCIVIFNIILFTLTARKIYGVQREMSKIIAREDSRKNVNCDKDQFGLFLRLFIVMGVTWSTDVLSYFLGEKYIYVFMIADFFNMIQGFIIFALFVMKKKVKLLIMNRFKKCSNNRTSQLSSKTSTSNITMNVINSQHAERPLMEPKD